MEVMTRAPLTAKWSIGGQYITWELKPLLQWLQPGIVVQATRIELCFIMGAQLWDTRICSYLQHWMEAAWKMMEWSMKRNWKRIFHLWLMFIWAAWMEQLVPPMKSTCSVLLTVQLIRMKSSWSNCFSRDLKRQKKKYKRTILICRGRSVRF